jgi:hypothetical protein
VLEVRFDLSLTNREAIAFPASPVDLPVVGMGLFSAQEGGHGVAIPTMAGRATVLHPGTVPHVPAHAFAIHGWLQHNRGGAPFAMKRPCAECPWRRDARLGKFPSGQFLALRDTAEPGEQSRIMNCHMTHEPACAGWTARHGSGNGRIRMAASLGLLTPEQLAGPADPAALYRNFDEMLWANAARPLESASGPPYGTGTVPPPDGSA